MRLDRLLCHLRFVKTRGAAQRWIAEGHIRRNGQRVTRQDQPIGIGDVLTLPLRTRVLPVEILALPARRGSATEARACYRPLDAGVSIAIAGGETAPEEGSAQP
ncbi:RNA-binding S4 domain-containing protein [Altererythrobacter soli]|uniref:RNA-binding S4 domain-containing protein n=1 Tax=Croceibacterium soli TaxID=1739690 RepID=A0A6I4UMZ6_9SPHN|nr:S4 domain-containing protein [Croceibacterium soli]MXP40172.1 RNA-binding S4 domain-containing protein [Croceibacterium soli]